VIPALYESATVTLYRGDCVEVMRELPEASVDAVVTDPPYGLEFMGKEWDKPWSRAAGAGGTSDGFSAVVMRDGHARQPLPSFTSSTNPTCRQCGGSRRGSDERERKGKKRCRCESPEFPNVAAIRGRGFQTWCEEWGREALRVLKPGAHLVAFGGTRTYHRLTCALEDAGFEIRDGLMWMYGSGFPKSLDVAKAIDKATGTRGTWRREDHPGRPGERHRDSTPIIGQVAHSEAVSGGLRHVYEPGSVAALQWQGWGTALKPAWEPIVLARKPLSASNVAANVLMHGTGAINVDACRIPAAGRPDVRGLPGENTPGTNTYGAGASAGSRAVGVTDLGRWPANVMLDEDAAALLDAQSGVLKSGFMAAGTIRTQHESVAMGRMTDNACSRDTFADAGGASRFFYTSKADREDRDGSKHPTVKPIDLMKWLVRLVTPAGGLVLDPFAGSGTTLYAARESGYRAIGIEREAEYCADVARRLRQDALPLTVEP